MHTTMKKSIPISRTIPQVNMKIGSSTAFRAVNTSDLPTPHPGHNPSVSQGQNSTHSQVPSKNSRDCAGDTTTRTEQSEGTGWSAGPPTAGVL
jgi:hypothetical protein